MKTTTFRLETLSQALEIGTVLSFSWFRGHSRCWGSLTPAIHRPPYLGKLVEYRPDIELAIIEGFKRRAPVVSEIRLPPSSDRLGWLLLMQHYRVPTRLLDWTKSILVALHFAVIDNQSEDGELWALLPSELNRRAGAGAGFPLVEHSKHVRFLLEEPYWAKSSGSLAEDCGFEQAPNCALAIDPPVLFPRMAVQSSRFTLHSGATGFRQIQDVLTNPSDLVRYKIPAGRKVKLDTELRALGITHGQLFPDLEGLARDLVDESRVLSYFPPDPPCAAGKIEDEP